MTNAQKWIAAFLAVFVGLLLLGKITQNEDGGYDVSGYEDTGGSSMVSVENDAPALLSSNRCLSCHGAELQGTSKAPALTNLTQHWDRNSLINYLRNPKSYSGDKRFLEYMKKYPGKFMPSFGNLNVKDLGKIADYLLSLK